VPEPILLDVSRLIWRVWAGLLPTGIDRTCLAYVAHYRDRARAVVQRGGVTRVFGASSSRRLFDILLERRGQARGQLLALLSRGVVQLPADLRGRFYLNVGHTGLNMPGHEAWLKRSGVRPIYFVHDIIPISHPEYCREGEAERHRARMAALLRGGSGVICNSQATLDELARFAHEEFGRGVPPALVAMLGHDSTGDRAPGAPPVASPYFVMLGTIEARKNHLLMLTLWAELARRLGDACPTLVVIGQRGWESEQAVDMLDRCAALTGRVVEMPRCDDATLAAYLRHARALLFPSFAEGYGLPLVEALGNGTPVLASTLPVFGEIAGDIPDYLHPLDGLGWMRAVEDYASSGSAARAAQVERLRGYRPHRWADHFAGVESWLAGVGAASGMAGRSTSE
jgi:glycosyltransferase involved in cell wall biosynthesis